MDWLGANCDRCEKGWAVHCHRTGKEDDEFYDNRDTMCPMECALSEGAMGDGSIPQDMAQRMGAVDHPGEFQWMCPEWEASKEWKAECVDGRNHYRQTERN